MLGVETPVIPSAAVNFQDAGRGDGVFFDPFGYGFSPYYLFDGGFVYGYGRRGYRGEYWDGRAGFHGQTSFHGERADVSHGGAVFQGGGGFHDGGAGGGFPRWWWRGRLSLRSRTEACEAADDSFSTASLFVAEVLGSRAHGRIVGYTDSRPFGTDVEFP
jgi:hypothetical protein